MTPEEKARIKIDQWFADAGWKVVNREDYETYLYGCSHKRRFIERKS